MNRFFKIIIFFIFSIYNCSTYKNSVDFKEIKKIILNKDIKIDKFGLNNEYLFCWSNSDLCIKVFNNEGKELCNYGKKGQAPGEFMSIAGVSINKNNLIVIIDNVLSRINYLQFSNNKINYISSKNIRGSIISLSLLDNNDVFLTGFFFDNSFNKISLLKKINYGNKEEKNFVYIDAKRLEKNKFIQYVTTPIIIENKLYLHYYNGITEIYEIVGDNLNFINKMTYDNKELNKFSMDGKENNITMVKFVKMKNIYISISKDIKDKKKFLINIYNKKSELISKKRISLDDSTSNYGWNEFNDKEDTINYIDYKNNIIHQLEFIK